MQIIVKLVILLTVLSINIPTQGEILIYSKLCHCWSAASADMETWNVDTGIQRGYIILDVDYDPNGELNEIIDIEQTEFKKEENGDKVYWEVEADYEIESIETDDEVIWVIEYIDADDSDTAEIIMLRGKSKDMGIGLAGNPKREVARELTGYILYLDIGMGVEKQMCAMSLRLQSSWTKQANNPREGGCNQHFGCSSWGIVHFHLERRRYQEIM